MIPDPGSLACCPYPPSVGASVTGIPWPGCPGGFPGGISGGIPPPGFPGEFPVEKQRPKRGTLPLNCNPNPNPVTLPLTTLELKIELLLIISS